MIEFGVITVSKFHLKNSWPELQILNERSYLHIEARPTPYYASICFYFTFYHFRDITFFIYLKKSLARSWNSRKQPLSYYIFLQCIIQFSANYFNCTEKKPTVSKVCPLTWQTVLLMVWLKFGDVTSFWKMHMDIKFHVWVRPCRNYCKKYLNCKIVTLKMKIKDIRDCTKILLPNILLCVTKIISKFDHFTFL